MKYEISNEFLKVKADTEGAILWSVTDNDGFEYIWQGDGTDLQLVDRLPEKEDRHEKLLNRIFLEEILEKLEGEEKRLIVFRYFQDMTQTEVAKKMGMSQVQISRMEKRILKKLREISHKL